MGCGPNRRPEGRSSVRWAIQKGKELGPAVERPAEAHQLTGPGESPQV
jgi:hypothetical protein